MSKIDTLKEKILKHNTLSIFIILIFITLASFLITYFIIYEKYQTEITLIKNNYIENQKNMMKYQVNNIIKLIETLRTAKIKSVQEELKAFNLAASNILKKCKKNKYKIILQNLDKESPCIFFTLSDLNANLIYRDRFIFCVNIKLS